jgi:hypothetical protein
MLVESVTAIAQTRVLPLHVTDPAGNPLPGIRISTLENGSTERTNEKGFIRIQFSADVKVGEEVELCVFSDAENKSDPWAFLSPYHNKVNVPTSGYVDVVVVKMSVKIAMMSTSQAQRAVLRPSVAEVSKPTPPSKPHRRPTGAGQPPSGGR